MAQVGLGNSTCPSEGTEAWLEAAWLEQQAPRWEGVRSVIQEHPAAGTEGWLRHTCGPGARGGLGGHWTHKAGWAGGPGRKQILSSKLDRALTSGNSCSKGDADFPRAPH